MTARKLNPFVRLIACTSVLLGCLCCGVNAQDTLYDNLDNFRFDDDYIFANGPDRRFAQQFLTRDNATIDQVTVVLTRPRSGATGSLGFELWRDNGSNHPLPVGDPAAKILDIGKVLDLTQIPLQASGEFTFDNLEIVLEPNSRYWVVANYSEVKDIDPANNRSVGWLANWSEPPPDGREFPPDYDVFAGTMGAAHANLYRDADPFWVDAAEVNGLDDVFFAMSVEAMPTPVFYNRHVPLSDDPDLQYINAGGPDRVFAQQFLMDSRRSLDEVVVSLSRQGSATGSIAFEIWSNSPSGDPMEKIAELGSIPDVSQLSPIPTAPSDVQFDNRVTGLTPENKYWVVADYAGLNGPINGSNSIGWTIVLSDEGGNGAANGHGLRPFDNGVWGDFGAIFGHSSLNFKMSVVSLGGDFDGDGMFTSTDIDLLTGELVAERNNTEFDLTGNNLVDQEDLEEWLSKAAEDNGIIQAYLTGDANLDGSVNAIDLNDLALNWRQDNEPRWSGGDFNADGVVNSADLNELALNWQQSIPMASAASAAVPEPSSITLLLLGVCALVRRAHRARG